MIVSSIVTQRPRLELAAQRYRRCQRLVRAGIFAGGLVGIFAFAIYVPFGIRHRNQEKLEQQRVIFPSGSPLISLRLSGTSDQPIWHIQALGEPRPVEAVRYGAVPAGFKQVFPASGPPRFLIPPEPIRLDAKAVGFDATNTGRATSADAVAFYSFGRKNSPGTSSGPSGSKVN